MPAFTPHPSVLLNAVCRKGKSLLLGLAHDGVRQIVRRAASQNMEDLGASPEDLVCGGIDAAFELTRTAVGDEI